MTEKLTYIQKKGAEIESVFEGLASLRIAVFREFPYLYDGSTEYEKEYLKTYTQSERSFLFAVYDGKKMVGATTCIPIKDETAEISEPFAETGFDINAVFYFGESILLPEYRGIGLGNRFFDEREAHARSFEEYKMCCFCSVERDENHSLKPADYRSNEPFWQKRGYVNVPGIQATMEWPDIGETGSSAKKMTFWIKNLN